MGSVIGTRRRTGREVALEASRRTDERACWYGVRRRAEMPHVQTLRAREVVGELPC